MAISNIQMNKMPADPELQDVLNLWKKNIFANLNCHAVATVQSFDSSKQLITATVNYKKTYFEKNQKGVYVANLVDYPILIDMPAVVLGGGGGNLTFPILQGDECLVLFNDRDLDNWFGGSNTLGVATPRMHSFSDGIALVGLHSSIRSIQSYDMARAVLSFGASKIGVGAKVLISNGNTLNTLLQNLVTAVKQIQIDVAGIGPSQGVVSATSVTSLTNAANALAGLLE